MSQRQSSGSSPSAREGGQVYSSAGIFHSRSRRQLDPAGFEAGLRSLTRELSSPSTLRVNYQWRSQALDDLAIDERTWDGLVARLPPSSLRLMLDLRDGKRQIAAVCVWVRVTFGSPAPPRPIEAAQPPTVRKRWRRSWNQSW